MERSYNGLVWDGEQIVRLAVQRYKAERFRARIVRFWNSCPHGLSMAFLMG
jgi:hypothetical protein